VSARPIRGLVIAAVASAGVWLLAGVRVIDPAAQFGVLSARGSSPARVVVSRLCWAAPGSRRFSRWPRGEQTVALPGAPRALLPSASGSRYGLEGWVSLRALPERAGALASQNGGIGAIVTDAVRAAAPALAEAEAGRQASPVIVRAFEERLRGELDRRGFELSSLEWAGFDYLRADGETAPVTPGVHVLLVGLDGADWEIVDPLIASGRLPNLARLAQGGVRAKLLSITPILSPVIWTSIATGVEPARHGVMDFLVRAPDGTSEPVTSRERKVPAIWELLSRAGVPVGVTGWWATWPASPVLGSMVTDRLAYQLFGFATDARSAEGKTWPPALYDAVRPLIVSPDRISWDEIATYLDGSRRTREAFDPAEQALLDELRTLIASGRSYLAAALAERSYAPARFEAVYFEGTDTVGHLFMPYRSPHLPGVDDQRFASFHDIVDRYYETADRMLGKLLEGRDDWIVIVCSDHGFASDATRPRTTDSRIGHGAAADWHRRFGVFIMSGPGVRRGAKLEEVSIYDLAPTILALFGQPVPISWPGHVLAAAMEPGWFSPRPVRFRSDSVPAAPASGELAGAGEGAADESHELEEKLQSLGYISGSAPAPMTTENNRGVAFLADGRFEDAAVAFRKAIADEPNQPTLWVNLGIALRFSGHQDEARTWFDKAARVPEGLRAAGHQLAQLDLEAGDLASAERHLRDVLRREPGAAEVRNSLGLVLERAHRVEEARREYERAAELDPNAAEPRNNIGNLAKSARRPDEAETWYLAAITADPYFMGAYNNLALLYQDRGETERAIALYDRAMAKAPTNAVVMNNLASLYYATGDLVAAGRTWKRAAEADPRYPSPLNNLAGLALAEGRDEEAETLLTRALALDPHYGDARINRALLAEKRHDLETARHELDEAERDPRAAGAALLQRGFLELAAGHPGIAVHALEQARGALGDRTDLLNALGEGYSRLGDDPSAVVAWRRSLAMDGTQTAVRDAIKNKENK
jgi:Flp pilus assembly protein TadD/predicted AlkP superfamily phosphohydrolase/phosphomutase